MMPRKDRKRSWRSRFRQLTPWNKLGVVGALVTCVSVLTWFIPNRGCEPSVEDSPGSVVHQGAGDINVTYTYHFYDAADRPITEFKGVEVLNHRIVDANRGYMKIRVSKEYLNTEFGRPVTLKYESREYQPVLLTFTNHETRGPGIVIASPEHKGNAEIFLYEQFRFTGFGKRTHTSDLVFTLYYNNYSAYLVTESGTFVYEKGPPMGWGKCILIGYFNESDPRNKNASKDLPALEAYFRRNR